MHHQDYKVGWICALLTEYVAARALLDQEYTPLPTEPNDNNTYTLGRIGSHDIVIACLPAGRYGIASAASVAKDMLRSFQSIRIGLMVGIGGGAPSDKHDIRLGDVVVGCPMKSVGGVLPYNFGKAIQDREFEPTGSLNSPPTALLTATMALSADHELNGNRIAKTIRNNQRLQEGYQYPGAESDRLYESDYAHHDGDDGCESGCDSTSPPLLRRPQRRLDHNGPVVHYGIIASADTLMKDAITRDRLIKKHDILCFEMEAAGLMNEFPCIVVRGICDYSDSHKNDAWQGYAAATAASYARELLCRIPNRITRAQSRHVVAAETIKPLFSVPFQKDDKFIDRSDIFAQIEKQLHIHHRASLCGIGGVGKSQIAIEYAYRFRQYRKQSHVFWVYAASTTRFMQAYRDIALTLKLPGCNDTNTDPCELVFKWLNEDDSGPWLMILDNADDADMFFRSSTSPTPRAQTSRPLIDFLPRRLDPLRLLIVTSRNRQLGEDLANGEPCVEISPFSSLEAKELLQSKIREDLNLLDTASLGRLLDVLGHIPLAITQAAAFMNRNRWPLQKYLAALEEDEQNLTDHLSKDLQDHRREPGFPNSVFRTWKLSFDQIQAQEPPTAKIFSLMAMLDRQQIPETLISKVVERDIDFTTAIGTLDGFSLISKGLKEETYAMHRLVQLSVRQWLEHEDLKVHYARQALQLLKEQFPTGKHENRKMCESLLPHAQQVLKYDLASEEDKERRAMLLHNVGWFHRRQGRYVFAHQAISKAYNIFREQSGEVSIAALNSLTMLASVLRDQGMYKAAEEMNRWALESKEKLLGFEHPDTLLSVNNLAAVLWAQGKYGAAEEMNRRALKNREKLLGLEHPLTLDSVNNLAVVLRDQGKHKASEEMNQRALKGREKLLGLEHPDTLISVNILAVVLQEQGKYTAAEEMSRRALTGRETLLGPEHPDTLTSVSNLASVLADQGDYKAAEEMYQRVLRGYETLLGPQHPETLISVYSLAYLFDIQQKYNDASILYLGASEGFLKTLGPDHPYTKSCLRHYTSMINKIKIESSTFAQSVIPVAQDSTTASVMKPTSSKVKRRIYRALRSLHGETSSTMTIAYSQ